MMLEPLPDRGGDRSPCKRVSPPVPNCLSLVPSVSLFPSLCHAALSLYLYLL